MVLWKVVFSKCTFVNSGKMCCGCEVSWFTDQFSLSCLLSAWRASVTIRIKCSILRGAGINEWGLGWDGECNHSRKYSRNFLSNTNLFPIPDLYPAIVTWFLTLFLLLSTIFWWPGTVTCSLLSSQSITFCPRYHVVSYEKVSQAISVEHVTYKYIKYKWIMDHNNESHSADSRWQCQQTWIIIWKLLFVTFDMFYCSFIMTVEVFHHHKAAV